MAAVYITGGATGIGAASARKFAADGADVAIFDVNAAAVEDLAAEGHNGSIYFFSTDVRNRDNVRQSVAAAAKKLGPPAALFINAGIQKLAGIFEMEDEDIDAIIDVNLKGALYTVAEVAALMRDAENGGTIDDNYGRQMGERDQQKAIEYFYSNFLYYLSASSPLHHDLIKIILLQALSQ